MANNSNYLVHVIDTAKRLHEVTISAPTHQGVKAKARKLVQSQGSDVLYVESLFVI